MTYACLNFSVLLLLPFICCNSKKTRHNYDPAAIELNKKAVDFIQHNKNDSALIYLDKALRVDTTYYIAYANRANVYCSLRAYQEALKEAENVVRIKSDLAEGWTVVGMLYDKIGDSTKAKSCYKSSIELYETRIANSEKRKDLEANILNKAVPLLLLGDKIKAQAELKKLMKISSKNTLVDSLLVMDKNKLINQFLNH